MSMNDSTATHPKSMDGLLSGEETCEGGSAAVLVSTRTEKGYFASNARETVHASVLKACQAAVNGTAFEVFPLQTKSNCNFTIDDPEWTYSYLDESWNSSDSAIVKYVVAYDEEEECFMSRKYEIHPMPYLECLSKNFYDIGMTKFCSMEGFVNASSSGNSKTKEEVFATEQNYCKQKVPAVVEPESSSSADVEETSSSSAVAPSGDMVSCDVPGVMGGCEEAPAGSDQARFYISSCESVLEGTLGTGCSN